MSSHTPLRLFPSATTSSIIHTTISPAQKSAPSDDLTGLALHITTSPQTYTPTDPIQHALFCDPYTQAPSRSKFHNGKRLSTCSSRYSQATMTSPFSEDELAPLPVNTSFGTSSPPKQRQKSQFKRPNVPVGIQTPTKNEVPLVDDDQLSPLPSRTCFAVNTPKKEYPSILQGRSASLDSTRSGTTLAGDTPCEAVPMRSIFPQYDPSRTTDTQQYYPTVPQAQRPAPLNTETIIEKRSCSRLDSAVTLVDGYEHIPTAEATDLDVIWKASIDGIRQGTRKVQLGVYQPVDHSSSIAIGCSPRELLYSMGKISSPRGSTKALVVQKHTAQEVMPTQVAHIPMPTSEAPGETSIFPQVAAMHAIEAVSLKAPRPPTFEARGSSYAAARLAQDAMQDAHRKHECQLRRINRVRDLMGGVNARYSLSHSDHGEFPITVTRSSAAPKTATRAKIAIHHPTATLAAIAAENLVLAFLDFGRDAFVIDVPGLLAFESNYIVDVAVSALMAVAAIENEAMKKDIVVFAAPPKETMQKSKSVRYPTTRSKAGKKKLSRSKSQSAAPAHPQEFHSGACEQVEVPGALALLGMSVKAGVFLVKIGLKGTKRAVVGAHHLAKKL